MVQLDKDVSGVGEVPVEQALRSGDGVHLLRGDGQLCGHGFYVSLQSCNAFLGL